MRKIALIHSSTELKFLPEKDYFSQLESWINGKKNRMEIMIPLTLDKFKKAHFDGVHHTFVHPTNQQTFCKL